MMMETSLQRLEYGKMKQKLIEMTVSPSGRRLAERLAPSGNRNQVAAWLNETEEASRLLAAGASVPLSTMEGIDSLVELLGKGKIYSEAELEQLLVWLASVLQMKKYMDSKREIAPTIASYAGSLRDCPELREELGRAVRFGRLTDQASSELASIRRQIVAVEDRIEKKLQSALSKYKAALQESFISKRNGRAVIAIKRELRKQVPGTVWGESASGQTIYVEPIDVAGLQSELQSWLADEERERTVILSKLSDMADMYASELLGNREAMASFDFIMARGKLARSYDGKKTTLSDRSIIQLVEARHPLLGGAVEPLTVELGVRWKQLIITGPNTGGKTVALKTIGLLAAMVQSGLLAPADEKSRFGLFDSIIADVGDGQSVEQSLSTFSSHLAVLKEMLEHASYRSLLLLDEMAAGTDPSEGIALSIAVLEELLERGSLVGATTHFNEIKNFAARTPGCMNAKMAFDTETLRPLYRLELGEAGDSHAFAIARRCGLPERVLQRAERIAEMRQPSESTAADSSPHPVSEQPTETEISQGNGFNPKEKQGQELERKAKEENRQALKKEFEPGDAVWIYPLKRTGIVYREADARGEVIVQVQGSKMKFNRKRLKLYIEKERLYPEGEYDMDIVFETKENRKIRKLLSRKHVEGLKLETEGED
ncbi:DNA mismatch repair protein MutS [Paenibacillus sp. NEAU-GSW1]|uniref:endonuclease MutS2 n=1 Tax=Paenibacillus sp. NEAU-GSW1 TaxID=2682486 RepID=UPI0012E0FCC3|nr:DNA mismatch repair protein MutS [Paenibacillus sp. NEAU-GSW1]MUT67350.1 DNA mismatch repair protein MutS [Paenibacillus sp. NEAU-GSW1]